MGTCSHQVLILIWMMPVCSMGQDFTLVHKCCDLDQVYSEPLAKCIEGAMNKTSLTRLHMVKNHQPIMFETGALEAGDCSNGSQRRILMPAISSGIAADDEHFQVLSDGRLFLPSLSVEVEEYCLEQCFPSLRFIAIACFLPGKEANCHEVREAIYTVAMSLSALSLALILVVYLSLPELMNAPGRNLFCLALSLMMAYVVLVALRLGGGSHAWPKWACIGAALVMYYAFMAAFTWMTVNAWDIHLVFGKGRKTARKRVIGYPLVGWGLPLLISLVTLLMELFGQAWPDWQPQFGSQTCWFNTAQVELLYFYGPIGTLLAVNWLLFLSTAWTLHQLQQEVSGRRHREGQRVQRLHLKLFTVMGLPWLFELLSWAWPSGGCWPWYVWTDLVNALQGLWMLFIFVAKKGILSKLRNRCFPRFYLGLTSSY